MEILIEYNFNVYKDLPVLPTNDEITDLHLKNCTQEIFDNLIIPPNINTILFFTSDLEHLIIPAGVTYCNCASLGLKTLSIPDSMEILYCDINCLQTLEIPFRCKLVNASYNKLTSIIAKTELPDLIQLDVENNRLDKIHFENCPKLEYIVCDVGVVISKNLLEQMENIERIEFQNYNM
jgi:hypothetical protein